MKEKTIKLELEIKTHISIAVTMNLCPYRQLQTKFVMFFTASV